MLFPSCTIRAMHFFLVIACRAKQAFANVLGNHAMCQWARLHNVSLIAVTWCRSSCCGTSCVGSCGCSSFVVAGECGVVGEFIVARGGGESLGGQIWFGTWSRYTDLVWSVRFTFVTKSSIWFTLQRNKYLFSFEVGSLGAPFVTAMHLQDGFMQRF